MTQASASLLWGTAPPRSGAAVGSQASPRSLLATLRGQDGTFPDALPSPPAGLPGALSPSLRTLQETLCHWGRRCLERGRQGSKGPGGSCPGRTDGARLTPTPVAHPPQHTCTAPAGSPALVAPLMCSLSPALWMGPQGEGTGLVVPLSARDLPWLHTPPVCGMLLRCAGRDPDRPVLPRGDA